MKQKTKIKTEKNKKRREINSLNKSFWKKMYFAFGDVSGYTEDAWEHFYNAHIDITFPWLMTRGYIDENNPMRVTTFTDKFIKEVING